MTTIKVKVTELERGIGPDPFRRFQARLEDKYFVEEDGSPAFGWHEFWGSTREEAIGYAKEYVALKERERAEMEERARLLSQPVAVEILEVEL